MEFYVFFSLAFGFNGGSSSAITIHLIDVKMCMLDRPTGDFGSLSPICRTCAINGQWGLMEINGD